jgi:hypothetical protein
MALNFCTDDFWLTSASNFCTNDLWLTKASDFCTDDFLFPLQDDEECERDLRGVGQISVFCLKSLIMREMNF